MVLFMRRTLLTTYGFSFIFVRIISFCHEKKTIFPYAV